MIVHAVLVLGMAGAHTSVAADALDSNRGTVVAGAMLGRSTTTIGQEPPFRVVLVQQLDHASARAVVIRSGPGRVGDVILVTVETTPSDMARAVLVLMRARTAPPRATRGSEMRAYVEPSPNRDTPNVRFASRELERLKASRPRPVMGYGRVRSIVSLVQPKVSR
jgi:hypothetical protein